MTRRIASIFFVLPWLLSACGSDSDSSTVFEIKLENVSTTTLNNGVAIAFSPVVWVAHDAGPTIYEAGAPASAGLKAFAEDGNAQPLLEDLEASDNASLVGLVQTTEAKLGLLVPGQTYRFLIAAKDEEKFSLVSAFLQGNDLVIASKQDGIDLFDAAGNARSGDFTGDLVFLDAGTEVNETPGAGPNQVIRQTAPGAGTRENGVVGPVADGFAYPSIPAMVRLTITPTQEVSD